MKGFIFSFFSVVFLAFFGVSEVAAQNQNIELTRQGYQHQRDIDASRVGSNSGGVSPAGFWSLTWGAVAMTSDGSLGVSSRKATKASAESEALARCIEVGNGKCKISTTYKNQCVAVGAPSELGEKGIYSYFTGPDVEKLKAKSVAACVENNGMECEVLYSNCTDAVWISG